MAATLLYGTAGFSYKDWIGPFYPIGTKEPDMLGFYSEHFDFVEVNSTYYHMPSKKLFESMDKKTVSSFRFSVKLFGGFTHERSSGIKEAENFMYSLEPVVSSEKLLCLLAQFPYSFHYNQDNLAYLSDLRKWFGNTAICAEFRNNGWINSQAVRHLKNENIGFVCVDEPQIRGLMHKVSVISSEISYVRFHGRNASKWYGGEGSERYDYMYSEEELKEWIPNIKSMENQAAAIVISFNNHPQGKAVMNARMIKRLMEADKKQV